ncbi:antichymotrypsin-2-like [Anoplophora glabripennis]|uniref:antichymotrypsin-2-like n=1 Tax=Anoplophora glabripennis TaxID=217634 RepID=UPI000874FB62|nr:antichymotrypsin-2-like [Anoplophora glabripennis]XP_018566252.1 antichymotrypsin-2-like [Anoplophora glabripennis]XP_023311474.1 antichymotrypsin-2-like [Anoplophora glabripennis]
MKCVALLFLICGSLATPVEDEALQEFVYGNHKFTAAVYKEILQTGKDNFVVSPLSAEIVLALTNEGARGLTASELVSGLSLPTTRQKTQRALQSFLPSLKKYDTKLKLLSANKIYVGKGLKIAEDFGYIANTIYDSGVENVDFERSTHAAGVINKWVEDNTNDKIRNLIKPGDINEATRMVLVNALYFSGVWLYPFDSYATSKRNFFRTKDNAVEVDTMLQVETFNYHESKTLNAKFLELPYQGSDIAMVIVLPIEKDGLSQLEQNLEQLLVPQSYTPQRVKVELPRFTIESETKFVPILQKLGISKLFSDEADLSGLSSTDKGLYVSNVLQKAFINVTESGTEAAAATSVGVALLSAPIAPRPIVEFKADHPFIYYLKDKQTGVVLFFGRYKGQ